jgi:outer membrane protein TolC
MSRTGTRWKLGELTLYMKATAEVARGCCLFLSLVLQAIGQPQPTLLLQLASPRPAEPPDPAVLRLSLQEAVALALKQDGNARVALAAQLLAQAEAQSSQERAALLPNLDASAAQQNRTTNLAAMGIQASVPIPGFRFPQFVGPFDTFDARVRATQSFIDLSAIRRYQASRTGVTEASWQSESTKNDVTALVAMQYLFALRAEARLKAAQAATELANRLLNLAAGQKKAGTGTGIEVTRAEVQLANERQQLLVAESERRKAHLQLARAIGLSQQALLELTQELGSTPLPSKDLAQHLETALTARADFLAQQKREERLRQQGAAARWERLPSVHGFADYGSFGSTPNNSLPTRTVGVAVVLPLFDGGRRDARRSEIESRFEQEKVRTRDLRAQIELEVRVADENLASSEQQVRVAEEGMSLAAGELAQAERRYRAGITTSVEVTDAQARLERSRENRIAALFLFNKAKIELGQASGTLRRMIEAGELGK